MKQFLYFRPERCTSCGACAMACIDQNDIALGNGELPFRHTFTLEEKGAFSFFSVSCMHCKDAPCVLACPVGCLKKDDATGYTLYDNTNCIGCHSCAMACPFGIPVFDPEGKMRKCDACYLRQEYGMQPACAKVCPTGALECLSEEGYAARREAHLKGNRQKMLEEQEKRSV